MSIHHNKMPRQVQVTNKQTGETQLIEAPEIKRNSAITNEPQISTTEVVVSDVKSESEASPEILNNDKAKFAENKLPETLEQFIEDFYSGKTKSLSNDRVRKIKKLKFFLKCSFDCFRVY